MSIILAIDDQIDNLITIQAILKTLMPEIEIITATSGLDGIKAAKEKQPSIILLDIIMPLMDGYDTCKVLKSTEATKHIPIVMITANSADSNSKVKALELGADAFIAKPIEPVELVAQLKVVFRIQQAEERLRGERNNLGNLVKERTRELETSEFKYRSLIENLQQPIVVVQNDKIVYANPTSFNILEFSENDLYDKKFIDFIQEEDKRSFQEKLKNIQSLDRFNDNLEFRIISKKGNVIWFSYNVNPFEWQGQNALLYNLNDITREKEVKLFEKIINDRTEVLLGLYNKSLNFTRHELLRYVIKKAMLITQSEVGFHHYLNENPNDFRLSIWQKETFDNNTEPVESRLPNEEAVRWLGCIKHKAPIVCNGVKLLPFSNDFSRKPIRMENCMSVPVVINDKVTLILGIGNKQCDYSELDIKSLELLASELSKIYEKRISEEELARNKEKYLAIHNNAPLPFQSLDSEGRIVEINPAWIQLLGYEREEVLGEWYGDFVHKDYVHIFKDNFPKLKKKGFVNNLPFKLRAKKGNYIEIRLDGTSGYDTDGNFMQTYCTFKNVTEEQIQQRRIEESEKKYRSFVEQFQGIAFLGYEDNSPHLFEGNVEDITGYSENDFIADNIRFFDLIHPDDLKRVTDSARNFMSSEKRATSREYRIIRKNGGVRWVFETVSKVERNNKPGVFGTIQDISKLKLTEGRLKESQKMAKVGSYDWDLIHDKLVWSEEMFNIFGLPKSMEPSIFAFANYTHSEDKERMSKEQVIKTFCEPSYELQYRIIDQSSGVIKYVQVWGKTEFNEKKEPIRVQGTFQDITSTKEIENELKNALKKAEEADKLKSAFLANMSHEIRTPMNGIMGFVEILRNTSLDYSEQKQYLNIVQASGERLLNTINDIIEISKIEAGERVYTPETKDLVAVGVYFQEFFEIEARNRQNRLVFENRLNADRYDVTTDFNKLESILSNLLKNALKFTSEGEVRFGVEIREEKLLFYVTDTGVGIPSDRLDAIFDRFVQASLSIARGYEGSGLGLSICKAYCEMLDGEIWVESQENVGSTFYFTIQPESLFPGLEMQETKKVKIKVNNSNRTIIVAEDDDISYQLIHTYLAEQQITILRAVNGYEVLKILSEKNDIALILMDIKMPELDGIETSRQIRDMYGDKIPIIAQSAFAMPGDGNRAIEAGCSEYITKPLAKERFLSTMHSYL